MKIQYFLILMIGLFLSCNKDEFPVAAARNEINLFNLQVGQISKYENFNISRFDPDLNLRYPGDTLIVEVIDVEEGAGLSGGDRFLISERYSSGSNVFRPDTDSLSFVWADTTSVLNYWSVINVDRDTSYVIPESVDPSGEVKSILTRFFGYDQLMPLKIYEGNELQITENDFSYYDDNRFCRDCFVQDFSLDDVSYDRLNVFTTEGYTNYRDYTFLTVIFGVDHGIVRTFEKFNFLAFTTAEWGYVGWDRIN